MSESADEPEIPPGTMLGRYRLDKQIGAGGMGAVYLAVHTGLNKQVVVKVLHGTFAKSEDVRQRFVPSSLSPSRSGSPARRCPRR